MRVNYRPIKLAGTARGGNGQQYLAISPGSPLSPTPLPPGARGNSAPVIGEQFPSLTLTGMRRLATPMIMTDFTVTFTLSIPAPSAQPHIIPASQLFSYQLSTLTE